MCVDPEFAGISFCFDRIHKQMKVGIFNRKELGIPCRQELFVPWHSWIRISITECLTYTNVWKSWRILHIIFSVLLKPRIWLFLKVNFRMLTILLWVFDRLFLDTWWTYEQYHHYPRPDSRTTLQSLWQSSSNCALAEKRCSCRTRTQEDIFPCNKLWVSVTDKKPGYYRHWLFSVCGNKWQEDCFYNWGTICEIW